jgi:carboxyl-terminal processing protease
MIFKIKYYLGIVILAGLQTWVNNSAYSQNDDIRSTTQKFASALQIINFAYVDSVNESELVEKAIIAVLKELDPHSFYISKKELISSNERLDGEFEGVGISFQIYHDTILVITPVPGGPTEKLGIQAGDKIISIDGENATGKTIDDNYVFNKLRGSKGTSVDLTILRKGRSLPITYIVNRDKIPINSVDAAFIVEPGIGFIKLNRFSRTSMDEFKSAVSDLKKEGMTSLILDLRGNSGGYLDVAVDLADEFISQGNVVLYTEGNSSPKRKYKSTFRGDFEKGKLVILIDEGSASASEIVAGAIQDLDRGIIIGRRSFGKGLVQRPYYLPDSSVIRLTVARYYTPSGRCIQRSYTQGYDQYYEDLLKRLENGELSSQDKINFPDSLKYYTPNQRIVYGGGGIMPDVFVPLDSTKFTDFYVDLLRKGIFGNFILGYLERERKNLKKKYPEFAQFDSTFFIDDSILEEFFTFSESKGVTSTRLEKEIINEFIRYQLKALIARNLFELKSYFQVMSRIDDGLIKTLDIIPNQNYFINLNVN